MSNLNLTNLVNIENRQGRDAAMRVARLWVKNDCGIEFGLGYLSAYEDWEEIGPPTACYVQRGGEYRETIVRMPDGTYELSTWGKTLETLEEERRDERNEEKCYACGAWYHPIINGMCCPTG